MISIIYKMVCLMCKFVLSLKSEITRLRSLKPETLLQIQREWTRWDIICLDVDFFFISLHDYDDN
jgi:hypothetical protein